MDLTKIYELGRSISFGFASSHATKRLEYIRFPYSAKDITTTTFLWIFGVFFFTFIGSYISSFISLLVFFFGTIIGMILYIYPISIVYSKEIMDYHEQMLRAVLSISNFISMGTSMEYGLIHTAPQIRGVLNKEFQEISKQLERRSKNTLGEAFEGYIQKWNEINPVFVKSLRLLQTASMAEEKNRDEILQEITESLMLDFQTQGKRSAEELTNKAKALITFGVLLPVTSLMILPLVSIFLPEVVQLSTLFFIYNILVPTFILLVALNFANKRIQIDTISLEEAQEYKTIPDWVYIVAFGIAIIFAIPGVIHLTNINLATEALAAQEYQFSSVFNVWLITLGVMIGIFLVSFYYTRLHKKLWKSVKETEDDLPHLLQILSTFLSLNLSIEKIIPNIVEDYESQGFKNHPIVQVFNKIAKHLRSSKENINQMITKTLKRVCPSIKVANILQQVIGFTEISQKSAVKSSKLIRAQMISVIKLEDYMRTLLAETTSLINISITMLMPLLCGVAIIMSLVIVQSLTFIAAQLESIQTQFGGTGSLSLVDITAILPPTVLEVVIGFYFIEMFVILSLFSVKISIGNDKFQFAKTLSSNFTGYIIFSVVLLGGHYLMSEVFFKGILGT